MKLSRESPLKNVPHSIMSRVYGMMDIGAKYKDLAGELVRRNGSQMFTSDDISLLDLESMRGSPSKAVFLRWSYEYPSIGSVLDQLCAVGLKQEADFIIKEALKETPPVRHDNSMFEIRRETQKVPEQYTEEVLNSCVTLEKDECQNYKYNDLDMCTHCFSKVNKIGSGGSCNVYKGRSMGYIFAVKIFKDARTGSVNTYRKQFQVEIQALSNLQHVNILKLYGYSVDGPNPCLVYEFMPGGTLEDRLALAGGFAPMTIAQRLNVLLGTAEGIHYIHSQSKIHRDIKSANVLLTQDLVPKIGDFGTLREGPQTPGNTYTHTSIVTGTHGYMAPEYYESVVSPGLDNYAFGVIIMECLTGLSCFDPEREEKYLTTYIKENCDTERDILEEVDKKVSPWSEELAFAMYRATMNLWASRKQRHSMEQVLPEIRSWKA